MFSFDVPEKLSRLVGRFARANLLDKLTDLTSSPSLLTGRIYDDRGNRMTPSHTVKKGARYRHYVSSATLHKRGDVGSVLRVPAVEIEELVVEALRSHCAQEGGVPVESDEQALALLERVVITAQAVKVHVAASGGPAGEGPEPDPIILLLPWTPQRFVSVKGVSRGHPDEPTGLKSETRDALLTAIAKTRLWLDDLVSDKTSISGIAKREGKGERHIRLLLPLAFAAPAFVEAIASSSLTGTATITRLALQLSNSWSEQGKSHTIASC